MHMLCDQFTVVFASAGGGQFHVYLTAQAQNTVPRMFAWLTYQTYQTRTHASIYDYYRYI